MPWGAVAGGYPGDEDAAYSGRQHSIGEPKNKGDQGSLQDVPGRIPHTLVVLVHELLRSSMLQILDIAVAEPDVIDWGMYV